MKRHWFSNCWHFTICVVMGVAVSSSLGQQLHPSSQPSAPAAQSAVSYLGFPRFKIPFEVDALSTQLSEVQLWVSTDAGDTWQLQGMRKPEDRQFEFKAAAEGLYLFSVQTVDRSGNAFPSQNPPLRVVVDTSEPQTALKADLNGNGQLVVDLRAADENLVTGSSTLRVRTDRDPEWRHIQIDELDLVQDIYHGQVAIELPRCRSVALIFSVEDKAQNRGEATFQFEMPRTASGDQGMQLASAPATELSLPGPVSESTPSNGTTPSSRIPTLPNTTGWDIANQSVRSGERGGDQAWQSLSGHQVVELQRPADLGPGKLASRSADAMTAGMAEELPAPNPQSMGGPVASSPGLGLELSDQPSDPGELAAEPKPLSQGLDPGSPADAYHCRAAAFSLDYTVEALGGTSLSEIELWGTENGGRNWQKWGTDPDRHSPFDVKVGNDGLFGFRMVIVGANGIISNRPRDGDSADVWINVDTTKPQVKITRAVYGEGPKDGMLVIDYQCADGHLTERPIALSYAENIDGPWNLIASGLENSGIHLWKPKPNLPEQIYLKIEAADRAGNVGSFRLDIPIDTRGLAPRGRIQGFRPIIDPQQ